jgi:hypothetical protein
VITLLAYSQWPATKAFEVEERSFLNDYIKQATVLCCTPANGLQELKHRLSDIDLLKDELRKVMYCTPKSFAY